MVKKKESILQQAAPLAGWQDTFIRAAKTFIATLLSALPVSNLLELDIATTQILVLSAASAGVGIVINRILAWTQS